MTTATEANGVQVTPERTIPALRRLVAQINEELDTARDPIQMTVLLDRRKAIHGALVALNKERRWRKERKERAQEQSSVEQDSAETTEFDPNTHEELADAVKRAILSGERCMAYKGCDIGPEANYEIECLDRVRQLVFIMGGLVSPRITMAQADEIDWQNMGPAAVHLDDSVVVAMPLENNDAVPRTCEVRGVLIIPNENVMPRG